MSDLHEFQENPNGKTAEAALDEWTEKWERMMDEEVRARMSATYDIEGQPSQEERERRLDAMWFMIEWVQMGCAPVFFPTDEPEHYGTRIGIWHIGEFLPDSGVGDQPTYDVAGLLAYVFRCESHRDIMLKEVQESPIRETT